MFCRVPFHVRSPAPRLFRSRLVVFATHRTPSHPIPEQLAHKVENISHGLRGQILHQSTLQSLDILHADLR